MIPAMNEGPKSTGALIVISVKSAPHLVAMSVVKRGRSLDVNFPSRSKSLFTNR